MEKLKQMLVVAATAFVILVNYLSTKGYIGGVTPEIVSNQYPTFLTPAGYAFSIWGLIYFGLAVFTVFQAMPSQTENYQKIRSLYLLSCLANCVWIFVWHNQLILISVGAMLVLLASLAAINFSLAKQDSWNVRVPFGMYFGWITVATLANIAVCLKYLGIEISAVAASIIIIITTIIGVLIHQKIKNAAYGLTVAWAITAIAVNYGGVTSISFASAVSLIALLIAVITPKLRLHEATS